MSKDSPSGVRGLITNLAGTVSQHMEYLPFGELLVDEHLNSHNSPFKFNAKEFDAETGNYYYGARYYSPKDNLMLSVDPEFAKFPSFSPYAYTLQNPVRYVDPTGMTAEDHEYSIDKDGRVRKEQHIEGSTTDTLHTKENWDCSITNEGIVVNDQNILSQLAETRTDWNMNYGNDIYPGSYSLTTANNFSEVKKIFEFASKSSMVEWKLNKHSDGVFLGTNHYSGAVNSYSLCLSNLTLLESYHSHPGTSSVDDVASGYSRADIQRMAKQGFNPENYGDISNTYRIYNELINAAKISPDNGYKGAPKFYIYRPHVKKPYYFQYDPWNTKF